MIMFTSSVRMIPIVESRRGKNAHGFNQLNFNFFLAFLFFSSIDVFCFDLVSKHFFSTLHFPTCWILAVSLYKYPETYLDNTNIYEDEDENDRRMKPWKNTIRDGGSTGPQTAYTAYSILHTQWNICLHSLLCGKSASKIKHIKGCSSFIDLEQGWNQLMNHTPETVTTTTAPLLFWCRAPSVQIIGEISTYEDDDPNE